MTTPQITIYINDESQWLVESDGFSSDEQGWNDHLTILDRAARCTSLRYEDVDASLYETPAGPWEFVSRITITADGVCSSLSTRETRIFIEDVLEQATVGVVGVAAVDDMGGIHADASVGDA